MHGHRKDSRQELRYLSYLVRLWQVDVSAAAGRAEQVVWRGSVQSSLTGELEGFATLDELLEFLREQTGTGQNASPEQS